jgi:hypothetical protein
MERDMGTTLATKADLHQLRTEVGQEFVLLRKDLEVLEGGLRKDLAALESGFRKDLEILSVTMTVRLGSMLVVAVGVLFAALKLT